MDLLPWVWVLALPMLYVARGVPVVSRYLLIVLPVAQALAWRTFESVFLGHEARRARARTRWVARSRRSPSSRT